MDLRFQRKTTNNAEEIVLFLLENCYTIFQLFHNVKDQKELAWNCNDGRCVCVYRCLCMAMNVIGSEKRTEQQNTFTEEKEGKTDHTKTALHFNHGQKKKLNTYS